MVALSGSGWRLAPSLVVYVKEADAAYPNRDRTSDGSIGDLAHASRESDHNPYDGWVHAVDLDENLAPGLDMRPFAAHLLKVRDPRIRYVIYEGRIFKSYRDTAGHDPWAWYPYTGLNDHSHHLHLSIERTATARNDLRAWGFKPPASPPPPLPIEARMIFSIQGSPYTFLMKDAGLVPLTSDEFWTLAGAGVPVKAISNSQFLKLNKQLHALASRALHPV